MHKLLCLHAAIAIAITPAIARAELLLDEPFAYPDGPLTTVSAGRWVTHSGSAGQVNVAGGSATLAETASEDVNATLAGGPYPATSSVVLYTALQVRFTALPSGDGGYFAHFKNAGTTFRGRIFATTSGAAPGRFRVGISHAAATPAVLERDLSLNTPYTLVTRYEIQTPALTLWVDPAAESDSGVNATDTADPAETVALALRQSLSSGNGIGQLTVDDLRVATDFAELFGTVEGKPFISAQPQDVSVAAGGSASFSVVAVGTLPLAYQWQRAQTNLPGATFGTLMLDAVGPADAGSYRVIVANDLGSVTSDEAVLTVTNAPPAGSVTNIAHLHTLLDPQDYLPTDTTTLFIVEGIVTTHTNLTTAADGLFYLQDETAGVAVFQTGATGFVPAAGDRIRVTAPLTHFNGLLELAPDTANPQHRVEVLSTGNSLPAARPLNFSWQNDPAIIEPYEGSYVVAEDVYLDLTTPTFRTGGENVTITNEFLEQFVLRVDARTDIGGQAKPSGPVTIRGVLGQFDTANPRTGGYQLIPTRFADILSASKAPTVRFTNVLEQLVRPGDLPTNTFTELILHPGEKLILTVTVTDPDGKPFEVETPRASLPPSAAWNVLLSSMAEWVGQLTWQPTAADAGLAIDVKLLATNDSATNAPKWTIYVPTAVEQQVVITEYLANPVSTDTAAQFNPLHRAEAAPQPSIDDEYVEIVNYSDTTVDLANWTLYDSNSALPRFRFYDSVPLSSSNVVVVYGGPFNGYAPGISELAVPSQEGSGLALNNDGDAIMLRNADGRLIARVVYSRAQTSADGSMSRFPDLNGGFVPQADLGSLPVTPGRQPNGNPWTDPQDVPVQIGNLTAQLNADGSVTLSWTPQAGLTYTVRSATSVAGPFRELASGISGGTYTDNALSGAATRFYRIRTP